MTKQDVSGREDSRTKKQMLSDWREKCIKRTCSLDRVLQHNV